MMAEIYDAILVHARTEAEAGDFAKVSDMLSAKTIEKKSGSITSLQQFVAFFGIDAAGTILAAWDTDEVGASLRRRLEIVGLAFYESGIIELIDALDSKSKLPLGIAGKLKEFGVTLLSPADAYDLPDVSSEACQASWNQYHFEQRWSQQLNDVLFPAIASGKSAAVDALKSVIAALEA